MFTATRTRDDVAADLARYRHKAGRMTCADEDWPVVHAILNELLTEMQRMGWHVPPTLVPNDADQT